MTELDFFFYIGSTYTYLAVNRVEEISKREGVTLRWRPSPGNPEQTATVIARLGRDPEQTLARANSEEVRAGYDAETEFAKTLGVFGSPTFVCGREVFWGDDRFEDALAWAKTHS